MNSHKAIGELGFYAAAEMYIQDEELTAPVSTNLSAGLTSQDPHASRVHDDHIAGSSHVHDDHIEDSGALAAISSTTS
ncbi:hypothetical protein MKX08_004524 [Trichoderma sp. CBMAI-0020]|nr:hypothetical protein MKX08_004524 [Trichoderma sp. CBMAI-0020]